MKRLLLFLAIIVVAVWGHAGVLDPDLASKLAGMSPRDELSVIVYLKAQADLTQFRPVQRAEMVAELHRVAEESQPPILSRFTGKIKDVGRFWIYNGFVCTASKEVIAKIDREPGVGFVCENEKVAIPEVQRGNETGVNTIEWNLRKVKADSVWRTRGYTGQGVVVGSIDTGVEYTHPALQTRWRRQDGWYDPVNHDTLPSDTYGHGTHTMGVAVGCAWYDTIGVAIGATWIAAYMGTQLAQMDSCFQWYARLDSLGRGAAVVFSSWGLSSRTDTHFWQACRNLQLLGTALVFPVGNGGPDTATVTAPANFPSLFAIGCSDWPDTAYLISARGPSPRTFPWDSSAAWLDPIWGIRTPLNHIKPDLLAPGVNIRSSYNNGGYTTMNGSSIAAPHVAGAIALLKQKNPNLTPSQLWGYIVLNCDTPAWGGPYPNYKNGFGRLNCLRAVDATPSGVSSEPWPLTPNASRLTVSPNPFVSFTSVPGRSSDRFSLYDISGRKVGIFKGNRIGEGLSPGVYFLCPDPRFPHPDTRVVRVVKLH